MKDLQTKNLFLSVFVFLVSFFVLFGCSKRYQLAVEPFAHEGNPQGASISIYINEMGKLFIADKDGTPIRSKPISLPTVLKMADREKPGWIQLLGSFTVFQIKKDQKVMLCDTNFQCVEGIVMEKLGKALFSVNYDRVSGKLFIADANGKRVGTVEKKMAAMPEKSEAIYPKGTKMSMEKLIPFTQLIESTDRSAIEKFRMLNTFIVFKVRGSQMYAIYNPLTNSCYVTCIDSNYRLCAPISGCCPPGYCP